MKTCSLCKKVKPIEEFGVDRQRTDGHRGSCKKCTNKQSKKRYNDGGAKKAREYYKRNASKIRVKQTQYYQNNKEKINSRVRDRLRADVSFRLRKSLSSRIYQAVKFFGQKKFNNTTGLIGCSMPKLILHLESQFQEGMTWENYGRWHIDHIKPCASFDLSDDKQQKECFHYTNLQPLWAIDNLRKNNREL